MINKNELNLLRRALEKLESENAEGAAIETLGIT